MSFQLSYCFIEHASCYGICDVLWYVEHVNLWWLLLFLLFHAHSLEYESIPKLIELSRTIYRCLGLSLNVGPWIKRRNELKIWLETKDMDKTVGLDVETISRKFLIPKLEMMFYKYFYVFNNLKNISLEQKFKENQKTKNRDLTWE